MKIYEYYTLQACKKRATKNLLFVIRAWNCRFFEDKKLDLFARMISKLHKIPQHLRYNLRFKIFNLQNIAESFVVHMRCNIPASRVEIYNADETVLTLKYILSKRENSGNLIGIYYNIYSYLYYNVYYFSKYISSFTIVHSSERLHCNIWSENTEKSILFE